MKIFRNNFKFIIGFLIGVILASSIAVYASINASEIEYKNGKKVSEALDELYTKSQKYKIDKVPAEYQCVECLSSTGQEFIDTGINPQGIELGIDMTFEYDSLDNDKCLFGENYWDGASKGLYGVHVYNGKFSCSMNNSRGETIFLFDKMAADKHKHNIKMNISGYGTSFDEVLISEFRYGNASGNIIDSASYTCYIFGRHYNNSGYNASGKIYDLKLYNGEELIRHYIPCYRKSDNVAGMYDIVGNKFYTNDGTGTFGKGRDITATSNW